MEKLSDLMSVFNFTDAEGKVITVMDGRFTLGQVVIGGIAIIAVLMVLKAIKSAVKYAVIIGVACFALVYFGVASPQQLTDIAAQIRDTGIEQYQRFSQASENIKIEGGKIYIKLSDGTWLDATDVNAMVKGGVSGEFTIMSNGESYTMFDSDVFEMLESFK